MNEASLTLSHFNGGREAWGRAGGLSGVRRYGDGDSSGYGCWNGVGEGAAAVGAGEGAGWVKLHPVEGGLKSFAEVDAAIDDLEAESLMGFL